jgi:hypothetical protein
VTELEAQVLEVEAHLAARNEARNHTSPSCLAHGISADASSLPMFITSVIHFSVVRNSGLKKATPLFHFRQLC